MAQTTDAMSAINTKVEFSANGTTWTDASGYANSIEPGGGERKVGEMNTFDGDTPIIAAGKRGAVDVKFKGAYTEGDNEPFDMAKDAYEAGSLFYVRWSPAGGATGDLRFTASGIVSAFTYPKAEAGPGDPIAFEFTLKAPNIGTETISV